MSSSSQRIFENFHEREHFGPAYGSLFFPLFWAHYLPVFSVMGPKTGGH